MTAAAERVAGRVREARHPAAAEWFDRVVGSDPGLNRLRLAAESVLTIGLVMVAEWIFVRTTHALQVQTHGALLPPTQAAAIKAGNHALLVVALMLGAVVGIISGTSVPMEVSPRRQLALLISLPVPMTLALALGLSMASHRVLSLTMLVVLLAAGTYCRRFGPVGFVGGLLVFMGDFFGFFLHDVLALSSIGWLAAEIGLATLVSIAGHFAFFRPQNRRGLDRLRRSYTSRARLVIGLAVELVDDPSDDAVQRLERQLGRLNETALMIDAQLALPAALPREASALGAHQRLFDVELALSNAARFATALARADVPAPLRSLIREALVEARDADLEAAARAAHQLLAEVPIRREEMARTTGIVVHRYAVSILGLVEAALAWRQDQVAGPDEEFAPSTPLVAGYLPGSSMVSALASTEVGPRRVDRILLAPYLRTALQMGVAVGAAVVFGDLLSGRRFYWAVIAAFVTFMGTNNTGEQVRKAVFRVLGTFFGIMVGAVLAHLVGTHTAISVAVILVSLFLGLYLMRVNYAFMVVGITVMVSQLYVQLGEYTNSLLVLRLEETALGAGIAIITVLVVLPLRSGHVLAVAGRLQVEALIAVVEQARCRLLDPQAADLRTAARVLDARHQALIATALPVGGPFGTPPDAPPARFVSAATAARHYARNLVVDAEGLPPVPGYLHEDLELAAGTLTRSLAQIVGVLPSVGTALPPGARYLRSAALFELVATGLPDRDYLAPTQLALRDLQLLDGAMARAAAAVGLPVHDLDTERAPTIPAQSLDR